VGERQPRQQGGPGARDKRQVSVTGMGGNSVEFRHGVLNVAVDSDTAANIWSPVIMFSSPFGHGRVAALREQREEEAVASRRGAEKDGIMC